MRHDLKKLNDRALLDLINLRLGSKPAKEELRVLADRYGLPVWNEEEEDFADARLRILKAVGHEHMAKFARDEHDNELFVRYRVTECIDQDRAIYTYYFDTIDEANAYAEEIWFNHLTEDERKHRQVYVLMVKACASPAKAEKERLLNTTLSDALMSDEDCFNEDGTFDLGFDEIWDLFGSCATDNAFDSENLPEPESNDEDEDED